MDGWSRERKLLQFRLRALAVAVANVMCKLSQHVTRLGDHVTSLHSQNEVWVGVN